MIFIVSQQHLNRCACRTWKYLWCASFCQIDMLLFQIGIVDLSARNFSGIFRRCFRIDHEWRRKGWV